MDSTLVAAVLPALVLAAGWRVLSRSERARGGLAVAAGVAAAAWGAGAGGTPARLVAAAVVLVSLAALGHVLVRTPAAGGRAAIRPLAEGLVSSLAAVSASGARLRAAPDAPRARAAEAVLALAVLPVPAAAAVLVTAPRAGAASLVPLGAGALAAAVLGAAARRGGPPRDVPAGARGVAFDPVLALAVAAAVAAAALLSAWASRSGAGAAAVVTVLGGMSPGADGVAAGEAWHRDALGPAAAAAALTGAFTLAVAVRLVVARAAGGPGHVRRVAPPAAAAVAVAWAGAGLVLLLSG